MLCDTAFVQAVGSSWHVHSRERSRRLPHGSVGIISIFSTREATFHVSMSHVQTGYSPDMNPLEPDDTWISYMVKYFEPNLDHGHMMRARLTLAMCEILILDGVPSIITTA